MKAFIFAMQKEADNFLKKVKAIKTETIAKKTFTIAEYNNKQLLVVVSGIGKVNASTATTIAILKFKADTIINIGLAGSITSAKTNVGDILAVTKTCQYDIDLRTVDRVKLGYMQDYNSIFFNTNTAEYFLGSLKGVCASADRFATSKELVDPDFLSLKPCALDMEAGAINLVAHCFNVPTIIIKVVSDIIDDDRKKNYYNNIDCALLSLENVFNKLLCII